MGGSRCNSRAGSQCNSTADDRTNRQQQSKVRFELPPNINTRQKIQTPIAEIRNQNQIDRRTIDDGKRIGKFTNFNNAPNFIESIFGLPLEDPNNDFVPPSYLFESILRATEAGVPAPAPPPFQFDVTNAAIIHNSKLLKKYNFDLEALLNDHQHTSVAFGSKFRPLEQ